MRRLEPFPVAVALSFIFLILYVVCVVLHLVLPDISWPMYRLWEMLLYGFTWISTLSFFLGAIQIIIIGFYVGYTLIPLYNYFCSTESVTEGKEMTPLRFKPIALAAISFGVITYVICFVFDLIFPQWAMQELWKILLPGFTGLNLVSFVLGLLGVIVYGLYVAAVFVPLYNNFRGDKFPEMK